LAVLGCTGTLPEPGLRMNSETYSIMMNFGWIEEGRLAGCRGPRSDNDLEFLASNGINALVRLEYEEVTGIKSKDLMKHGIEDCYEPVKDFTPPSQEQIVRVITFIRNALNMHKIVAVSCNAGYGRTGTILACYFVSLGYPAEEAIEHLIQIRPVSEVILRFPAQKEAVIEFAQRLPELAL
jgi:atypical dual specificity phosphatase